MGDLDRHLGDAGRSEFSSNSLQKKCYDFLCHFEKSESEVKKNAVMVKFYTLLRRMSHIYS